MTRFTFFRRNALERRDLVPPQLGRMDSYDDYNYDEAGYEEEAAAEAPVDESGTRNTWEILTWIIIALTILLNLALVAILVLRRNLHSIVNKSEPWVGGGRVSLQVTCFQLYSWLLSATSSTAASCLRSSWRTTSGSTGPAVSTTAGETNTHNTPGTREEPSRRLSFTIVEGSYEPLRGLKFHNHE